MKQKLFYALAIAAALTAVMHTVFTVGRKQKTMTMQGYGGVIIFLAGTGTATIDWGGSTLSETLTLSSDMTTSIAFRYLADNHVITITGDNITELGCSENHLTSLDVSRNSALEILFCDNNELTRLDVSKNFALTCLYCGGNQLTNLDVSKNPALTYLDCGGNSLTSLNVSRNSALTDLWCHINLLTSLDVSNNPALEVLNCSFNELTSLDVSRNFALIGLACIGISLSHLDVSQNPALRSLKCNENHLTSLDVSQNPTLESLWCSDNQLTIIGLNALFGTLHSNTISDGKSIYISDNLGTDSCNTSIATAKGWEVVKETFKVDLFKEALKEDFLKYILQE